MTRSTYRPRAIAPIAPIVEAALKTHPVVVVTGSRQTGKTTLVRHLPSAPGRRFETLDDVEVLGLARKRPEDLKARAQRLTLDEIQRAPELV